jgi:hypothetical protein
VAQRSWIRLTSSTGQENHVYLNCDQIVAYYEMGVGSFVDTVSKQYSVKETPDQISRLLGSTARTAEEAVSG